jgi:hypothetical protein
MVRLAGLEPARVSPLPPQSSVSANSTISANYIKTKDLHNTPKPNIDSVHKPTQRSTRNSDKFSPTEGGLRRYIGCDRKQTTYGTYHINKNYRGFLIQQSTKTKSKRIAQIRFREAMDKLDKTLGVTQVNRAATSGNATFAELVEVFKRDIDLSEREHSTKIAQEAA